MTYVIRFSIPALRRLLLAGQVSSSELTKAYIENIRKTEPQVSAFLTVCEERALQDAEKADRRLAMLQAEGKPVPSLLGIPMAVKDNICTKGIATTCASRMLEHFTPPYDATVIQKLSQNGSPLLGKLNMDEFGIGVSTENSAFFSTKNPLDVTLVPGGSSGGSAAAVAAAQAPFALGSDTGGSIRQPAAFCGVVGINPTYGRVSRYGLAAYASSLDQIGPLTKTVAENALILEAIAGQDAKDVTTAQNKPFSYMTELDQGVKGVRIGLIAELLTGYVQESIRANVVAAGKVLEKAGAKLEFVSLPSVEDALAAYTLLSSAELASNLARFDGVRFGRRASHDTLESLYKNSRSEGLGAHVKQRILAGTMILSSDCNAYAKALSVKKAVQSDFAKLFQDYDALLCPVVPRMPFPLGTKLSEQEIYTMDLCTVPASLAGLPALSMPCAWEQGLPCGMQLIGPAFSEGLLYRIGRAFERESGLVKEDA
jgi:aspartyl-tRNA(Asn)/glutamyl-tRNA(Gln) amidotransferase subunit A